MRIFFLQILLTNLYMRLMGDSDKITDNFTFLYFKRRVKLCSYSVSKSLCFHEQQHEVTQFVDLIT